jgi:hypothetical protein
MSDLYRGFESISFRQQVLTAEKFLCQSLQNTRDMPVFRDVSSENRTAENGLLGIECSHQSTLFSGRQMRSPVSQRALGECNAIRSARVS